MTGTKLSKTNNLHWGFHWTELNSWKSWGNREMILSSNTKNLNLIPRDKVFQFQRMLIRLTLSCWKWSKIKSFIGKNLRKSPLMTSRKDWNPRLMSKHKSSLTWLRLTWGIILDLWQQLTWKRIGFMKKEPMKLRSQNSRVVSTVSFNILKV